MLEEGDVKSSNLHPVMKSALAPFAPKPGPLHGVTLALESPHQLTHHQTGLGRECVLVRLTANDVTPYATYELAGTDEHGRRYCVRGDYVQTELDAIASIGRRTGTNLEVA